MSSVNEVKDFEQKELTDFMYIRFSILKDLLRHFLEQNQIIKYQIANAGNHFGHMKESAIWEIVMNLVSEMWDALRDIN